MRGEPAAFGALLHFPHAKRNDLWSVSRLVVRPDYQGLGLGAYSFVEALGKIVKSIGGTMSTHPAHPALIQPWAKSPLWKMTSKPAFASAQSRTSTLTSRKMVKTGRRRVAHFQYVGPGFTAPGDIDAARTLWR